MGALQEFRRKSTPERRTLGLKVSTEAGIGLECKLGLTLSQLCGVTGASDSGACRPPLHSTNGYDFAKPITPRKKFLEKTLTTIISAKRLTTLR